MPAPVAAYVVAITMLPEDRHAKTAA